MPSLQPALLILACAVSASCAVPVRQEREGTVSREKGQEKEADPREREIRSLVADLGDDEWKRREAATKRLERASKKVIPFLQETYRECQDPEVTVRIRKIARTLYDRLFYPGIPYLGLTFNRLLQADLPGAKEGERGFSVAFVKPGRAAEAAGLREKDVIVAFGRHRVATTEPTADFAEWVHACKVDQEVEIEILRAGERVRLRARLGSVRPGDKDLDPTNSLRLVAETDAAAKFELWWKAHFELPQQKDRGQRHKDGDD